MLTRIASLSKKDREEISRSHFIRSAVHKEKKALSLTLVDKSWQTVLDDGLPLLPRMLHYFPKLFAEVNITIDADWVSH